MHRSDNSGPWDTPRRRWKGIGGHSPESLYNASNRASSRTGRHKACCISGADKKMYNSLRHKEHTARGISSCISRESTQHHTALCIVGMDHHHDKEHCKSACSWCSRACTAVGIACAFRSRFSLVHADGTCNTDLRKRGRMAATIRTSRGSHSREL